MITQWEYLRHSCIDLNEINNRGRGGWQLCSVVDGLYIFKRPIGPDWKARCEAAEAVINTHDLSTRIKTAAQSDAWREWQNIKNKQS